MRIVVRSPIDESVYTERETADSQQIDTLLEKAQIAQEDWERTPVPERRALLTRWISVFLEDAEAMGEELTWQMGRPRCQTHTEFEEFEQRALRVLEESPERLEDVSLAKDPLRFIRRHPVGTVLIAAGWNYPYVIAAHTVVPALMSGNAVLLRHSPQTPLCSERLALSFLKAGGPEGLLQAVHLRRAANQELMSDPRIGQVALTGVVSQPETRLREQRRYVGVGLELGGKDCAYVRPDCDMEATVEALTRATFYNAGQSCCGVERIYVHQDIYQAFLEALETEVSKLVLGDPTDPSTTLGPMVKFQAAAAVYDQVSSSIRQGAKPMFPHERPERAYVKPQVLYDVDNSIKLMAEETFGPAVGIMSVNGDEHALELMNDSRYALAASVWTADLDEGLELATRINTSSVFVNRCDFLNPAIGWLGRGFTLSSIGFEMLTRAKTYELHAGAEEVLASRYQKI